jgi:hypothetical protein
MFDMIEGAPEDSLRALHAFLVGEPDDSQQWCQGQLSVFVSHLAIHQTFVGNVGNALAARPTSTKKPVPKVLKRPDHPAWRPRPCAEFW